jgi:hypothetical protein
MAKAKETKKEVTIDSPLEERQAEFTLRHNALVQELGVQLTPVLQRERQATRAVFMFVDLNEQVEEPVVEDGE